MCEQQSARLSRVCGRRVVCVLVVVAHGGDALTEMVAVLLAVLLACLLQIDACSWMDGTQPPLLLSLPLLYPYRC